MKHITGLNMRKVITLLIAAITLSACASHVLAKDDYLAGASEWAIPEIVKANVSGIAEENVLKDYELDITRVKFCELIANVYTHVRKDRPAFKNPFSDINSNSVSLLYKLGIVNGVSDTEFAPFDDITREEAAVIIGRALTVMGHASNASDITVFSDCEDIAPWAAESVGKALSTEIMKGVSETRFAPREKVTCEQAIVMAWRLYLLFGLENDDILLYEETTLDILTEFGIVSEEDMKKDGYITVIEALETIVRMKGSRRSDTSDWYLIDAFKEMDDVDDDIKLLLLSLRTAQLTTEEITGLKISEDLTNFEALLYITRLIRDSYGCTFSEYDIYYSDRSEIYLAAYRKGLIPDTDMSAADEKITRKEFYNILHKAIFVQYYQGGYALTTERWIDSLISRRKSSDNF